MAKLTCLVAPPRTAVRSELRNGGQEQALRQQPPHQTPRTPAQVAPQDPISAVLRDGQASFATLVFLTFRDSSVSVMSWAVSHGCRPSAQGARWSTRPARAP